MIDALMLEKKYYELMGEKNITVIEDGGNRWLEAGDACRYSLPTICGSTAQAKIMLLHKISVNFYEAGVEAWHNDGGSPTTMYYHRDKSTRAYFSDDETFNVAVLQAAVEMLERNNK